MKAVVIGNGSMGNRRIRHAKRLGIDDVLGFDIRADRRKAVEEAHGIRTIDSRSALIAERPDLIFISVPPAEHRQYIDLAIEQGWHFMSEQPVLHELRASNDLADRVEARGIVSHVSCNKRFHPAIRQIKEMIAKGDIGPVITGIVEIGEWLPDWHPYEPYTDYYPSKRLMGGGLDVICDLEWVQDIFGSISRVGCLASKRTTLEIDTEDVVQMIVDFRDGPQVVLHADMVQRAYAFNAKFAGERGTVEWDWANHKINLFQADSNQWQQFDEEIEPTGWPSMQMKPGWEWVEPMYYYDAQAFFARVKANDTATTRLREALGEVKTVLAALEASRSNTVWSSASE